MPATLEILQQLVTVTDRLRQDAENTHRSPLLPRQHLRDLARAGLFELALPNTWNGLDASLPVRWEAAEMLSSACGVTQFVQAQHAGALHFLANSPNRDLAAAHMPAWRSGERFCGVAFAHLRRPSSPVTVTIEGDDFIFRGEAPWFSGWGIMDEVVLAGTLQEGQYVYVLVRTNHEGIQATPVQEMAAMNASSTVTLLLNEVRVPRQQLVMMQTPEDLNKRDYGALLRYAAPPLGVVRAACALLQNCGGPWADAFQARVQEVRQRALAWDGIEKDAVLVRTAANEVALHASQAAIVACGGSANRLDHPAQRLAREASFYYLTQLTAPLREAALTRLAAAGGF